MPITVELFDGSRIEFPDGTDRETIERVARQKTRELQGIKPESGGVAAFKAGIQSLIGSGAALAGRTGLMDVEAAQREYEARKQRAAEIFQPGAEGWSAPLTKISELAGGSLPYMAVPVGAGLAAMAAPVTGAAATALGLGAAGLTSAGQFTATNLARQLEEGKRLQETDLAAAAAAAVPQALLDTIALRMMPGVGRIFGQAGVKVTKENAEAIAKQALSTTLKDYAVTTGKTMTREGVTEAAQQALERLQAGLNITDPQARAEYFESFVGGAVLGGVVSPAGRFFERGSEQRQARRIIEDEANRVAQEQRAAEEAQKQTPEYLFDLEARYKEAKAKKEALDAAAKKPGKGATQEQQSAYAEAKKTRDAFARNEFAPIAKEYNSRKQEIDVLAQQRNQAAELAASQTVPQEAQTQPFYEAPQGTLPGMEAVEQPAAPTVEEPVDYKTIVAKLNAYLDDLRTRAQTTVDLDEKLKLGEAYAQAQKALKEAEEKAKQAPGTDNRERLLRKKMAVAEEEGDVAAQAALAKQLKELGVTDLRTAQPELPGMQTDFFEPGAVQKRQEADYEARAQAAMAARPDLAPTKEERDPLALWKASLAQDEEQTREELLRPDFSTIAPSGGPTVAVPENIKPLQKPDVTLKRVNELIAARDQADKDREAAFAAGNRELGVKKAQELEAAQSALNSLEQTEGPAQLLIKLRKEQDAALVNAAQFIDDLRAGRTLGGIKAGESEYEYAKSQGYKGTFQQFVTETNIAGTASSTPQTLISQINKKRDAFINAAIQEAAITRRFYAKGLTQAEADAAAKKMRKVFDEWVTRSMAQPVKDVNWVDQLTAQFDAQGEAEAKTGDIFERPWVKAMRDQFIKTRMSEELVKRLGRQRMAEIQKGTAELKGAETELPPDTVRAVQAKATVDFNKYVVAARKKAIAQLTDPRPPAERQFGAYRAAVAVLDEQLRDIANNLKTVKREFTREEALLRRQTAEGEAAKFSEERGETTKTLEGALRRYREYVGDLIDRAFQTRRVPGIAQMLLTRTKDFLDQNRGTGALLEIAEDVASRILRGQNVERSDLVKLRDEVRAESNRPGEGEVAGTREGQLELFSTAPSEQRRLNRDLGVWRSSPGRFKNAPEVVQARATFKRGQKLLQNIKNAWNKVDKRNIELRKNKIAKAERTVAAQREDYRDAFMAALTRARLDNVVAKFQPEIDEAINQLALFGKEKAKALKADDKVAAKDIETIMGVEREALQQLRQDLASALADPKSALAPAEMPEGATKILRGFTQPEEIQAAADDWVQFERNELRKVEEKLNRLLGKEETKPQEEVSAKKDVAEQTQAVTQAENIVTRAFTGLGLPGVRVNRQTIKAEIAQLTERLPTIKDAKKRRSAVNRLGSLYKALANSVRTIEGEVTTTYVSRLYAELRELLNKTDIPTKERNALLSTLNQQIATAEAAKGSTLSATTERRAIEAQGAKTSAEEKRLSVEAIETQALAINDEIAELELAKNRARTEARKNEIQADIDTKQKEFEYLRAQLETPTLTRSEKQRARKAQQTLFRLRGKPSESAMLAKIALKLENKEPLTEYEKKLWERRALKPEVKKAYSAASEALRKEREEGETRPGVTPTSVEDVEDVKTQLGIGRDERYARGVETATPDLDSAQIAALEANDVGKALSLLSKDGSASEAHRKVAARLVDLLDDTRVEIVDGLKDADGKPVLGAASTDGKLIQLDRKTGLSHEALLHEAVHAAAERVLNTADAQLTKEQVAAKRELRALFEAIKRDPRITSANAKSSINEFVAEVMSNKNLQQQLSKRPWRLADALRAFKSVLLRMLGVKDTETMLGAATKAIDAIFLPTSVQLTPSKRAGKRQYSQKDIAALHTGSNSMRQFADNFGQFIKQKDRTVEDVERISTEYLNDMYKNPEDYVAKAEPDRLDYKSATIMPDGKVFDPDNLLHLVEATPDVFASLRAQKDEELRQREAAQISEDRFTAFNNVLEILTNNPNYTLAENALVAKAAAKFGVISTPQGRLKLVNIDASNRHPIAIVDENAANAVIEELRAGKSLKDAFLDGLQKNADNNAERNRSKNGWQKFEQSKNSNELEDAAIKLNAGAAGTSWCTGASVNHARYQIEGGDFYIYYENGKPEVAVRMTGTDRINEIRGNTPNQALNPKQQEIADKFLRTKNFDGSKKFFNEVKRRSALIRLFKNETKLDDGMYFQSKLAKLESKWMHWDELTLNLQELFEFPVLDGYASRLRPVPSDEMWVEARDKIIAVMRNGMDAGYIPFHVKFENANTPGTYTATGFKTVDGQDEERTVLAKDLVMAEKVTVGEKTITELPKLEKTRMLLMFSDKLKLPALQKIDDLSVFNHDEGAKTVLTLGKNAIVNDLRPYYTVDLKVVGGNHITFTSTTNRGVFSKIVLDAPYVTQTDIDKKVVRANIAQTYANKLIDTLRSVLSKKHNTSLYLLVHDRKQDGLDSDEWLDAYKTAEQEVRKFARIFKDIPDKYKNADVLVEGLDDGAGGGYVAFKDFLDAWLEVGKIHAGKKLSANTWQNNLGDIFDPFLEDGTTFNQIGKNINAIYVSKYEKPLTTALPIVSTPNKIADAPPLDQAGPEEEPRMRYARANTPVANRVIDATVASQRTWKDDVKDNLLNFRTQYLDKLFPAEQALKLGGVAQKVATQAMYYLRMYDYRMHMTSQAAFVGAPDLVEKTRKDGSKEWVIEANKGANIADAIKVISKKDVADAAGGADNAGRMMTMYMAAIRGERVGYEKLNFGRAAAEAEIKRIEGQLQSPSLSQEARSNLQKKRKQLSDRLNTLPTEADFKAIRAEVDANETLRKAFNEAREIYNQYNRNLLNFVVKTGAISRAKADEWIAQGDYVPYYRMRDGVAELLIGGETPIRIGNLKDSPHLEKLVGGDEPIMNFLDSSVTNTAMLLEMGMHNLAMRNLMFELQHVGLAKISKETKRTSAPEGAVTFKMDGNDHFAIVDTDAIGVDSELLVKGLAGIPTMLPTVTKLMGIPARILRKMVLASPVYWGRQLVRDSTAAALASGADMLPVIGALKQIGKENILEARGITGGQVFTGMPEDMADILRGMQRGKISLSGGLAWLEAQSAKADALTRKAQYDSYIEQGMSEMEATLMAMESMNFARRGLSPSLHMLSTVIPFFNAQLQGLDVLYRSFFGKMPMNEQLDIRRKLLARGMLLFGMSMMYAFLMQDDEAYKNAKPEEKYGNWFVPLPGTDQKLRVPIPFELGYIFKALPEALVNSMMSEEGAEDAVKAFTHILQQTIPGGSSYMLPQAIKPGLEVLMGTSMYTGRGIESGREQQMEAGYRVRESTTEAAAWLGEATGFSPIKMEYLIRGYTAGVGIAFLQALSLPMARSGPERAERRPSDLPVVGTLFQPSDASGIIDATYERMQELAQKEDTYKRLLKEGRTEAAAEYLEKNAGVVGYESLAGRFRQQMGKITDYERRIRASDMTPQEKRQRLDEMRDAKIRLAAAYREAGKTARQASQP